MTKKILHLVVISAAFVFICGCNTEQSAFFQHVGEVVGQGIEAGNQSSREHSHVDQQPIFTLQPESAQERWARRQLELSYQKEGKQIERNTYRRIRRQPP